MGKEKRLSEFSGSNDNSIQTADVHVMGETKLHAPLSRSVEPYHHKVSWASVLGETILTGIYQGS